MKIYISKNFIYAVNASGNEVRPLNVTRPYKRGPQNSWVATGEETFRDAGMYCLSYIRLLELEMNEHIIPHLRIHREELMRLYKNLDPAESVSTIESKNKWKKLTRRTGAYGNSLR